MIWHKAGLLGCIRQTVPVVTLLLTIASLIFVVMSIINLIHTDQALSEVQDALRDLHAAQAARRLVTP